MRGEAGMTPECQRLWLTASVIQRDDDVELLRQIRNACKDGFAHDNEEITPAAQELWWMVNRARVKAWLYWRFQPDSGLDYALVGYGLLRQTDDGRWWSSVAVLPAAAGRGYGGAITADLVRRIDEPIWAEARLDQPAAMRLHRAADWQELYRDGKLAHYRTLPHVYDPVLRDWAENGMCVT